MHNSHYLDVAGELMLLTTSSLSIGATTHLSEPFKGSRRIATDFLGSLPGSCSNSLVRDEKGHTWVLKAPYVWQSPLLSFTEALATELMLATALPCPPWCVMTLNRDRLLLQPEFRPHEAGGLGESTYYFASRYVPDLPGHRFVSEACPVLPSGLAYRDVLVGAYVFDVWVANQDKRQMLSALTDSGASIYLFDNSHLFGRNGERIIWRRSNRPATSPINWVADQRGSRQKITKWISLMQERCPAVIEAISPKIPAEWSTNETEDIKKRLLERLESLRELVLLDQQLAHHHLYSC